MINHLLIHWGHVLSYFPGAVRLVEMKYLRRDPQDEDNSKPSYSGNSRGGQAGRIYTPRNRGMRGGGGGW